jgi:hypothetical protein
LLRSGGRRQFDVVDSEGVESYPRGSVSDKGNYEEAVAFGIPLALVNERSKVSKRPEGWVGRFRGSGFGHQHLDLGLCREIGIGELFSLWF